MLADIPHYYNLLCQQFLKINSDAKKLIAYYYCLGFVLL